MVSSSASVSSMTDTEMHELERELEMHYSKVVQEDAAAAERPAKRGRSMEELSSSVDSAVHDAATVAGPPAPTSPWPLGIGTAPPNKHAERRKFLMAREVAIRDALFQLSDEDIAKRVALAKSHPKFGDVGGYLEHLKADIGVPDEFGDEEPIEDIINFEMWLADQLEGTESPHRPTPPAPAPAEAPAAPETFQWQRQPRKQVYPRLHPFLIQPQLLLKQLMNQVGRTWPARQKKQHQVCLSRLRRKNVGRTWFVGLGGHMHCQCKWSERPCGCYMLQLVAKHMLQHSQRQMQHPRQSTHHRWHQLL